MTDQTETDEATKAKGREEKELNEQAAQRAAEEKQAEAEAEIEKPDTPDEPTDPDQLRGEIADAREELGETVEALAAKADVKAQAKEKVEEQKAQLKDRQQQTQQKVTEAAGQLKENPSPLAIAGAVAVLLGIILITRKGSK